jgi:hypothetical protein
VSTLKEPSGHVFRVDRARGSSTASIGCRMDARSRRNGQAWADRGRPALRGRRALCREGEAMDVSRQKCRETPRASGRTTVTKLPPVLYRAIDGHTETLIQWQGRNVSALWSQGRRGTA